MSTIINKSCISSNYEKEVNNPKGHKLRLIDKKIKEKLIMAKNVVYISP
jgi:hypothetical protein